METLKEVKRRLKLYGPNPDMDLFQSVWNEVCLLQKGEVVQDQEDFNPLHVEYNKYKVPGWIEPGDIRSQEKNWLATTPHTQRVPTDFDWQRPEILEASVSANVKTQTKYVSAPTVTVNPPSSKAKKKRRGGRVKEMEVVLESECKCCDPLRREVETLKGQLDFATQSEKETGLQLHRLQDKLQTVLEERDSHCMEVREQSVSIRKLSSQLQVCEDCNLDLHMELSGAQVQIAELERSSRVVIEQLEDERRTRAALQTEITTFKTRLERCEQELEQTQLSRDTFQARVYEQQEEIMLLQNQLQLCQHQLLEADAARKESLAQTKASEMEVSRLTHQLGVLEQEHQGTVSHLQDELEGTRAQCQQLQDELSLAQAASTHVPTMEESSTTGGRVIAPDIFCTEERLYPVLLEAVLASTCDCSLRKMETPHNATPTNQGAAREEITSPLPRRPVSDHSERQSSSWPQEELRPFGILGIAVGWALFKCSGGGHHPKERLGTADCVLVLGLQRCPGDRKILGGIPVCPLTNILCLWTVVACSLAHWTRGLACLLPRDYGPTAFKRPSDPADFAYVPATMEL